MKTYLDGVIDGIKLAQDHVNQNQLTSYKLSEIDWLSYPLVQRALREAKEEEEEEEEDNMIVKALGESFRFYFLYMDGRYVGKNSACSKKLTSTSLVPFTNIDEALKAKFTYEFYYHKKVKIIAATKIIDEYWKYKGEI